MRAELEAIIAYPHLSASAKLQRLLERLLDPTPEMVKAMETVEPDFGRKPGPKDFYQAGIWELITPRPAGPPSLLRLVP